MLRRFYQKKESLLVFVYIIPDMIINLENIIFIHKVAR